MIPQYVLEHLELREGRVSRTYSDSEGYLTGGVGHLLSADERALYPIGTALSDELVDNWLDADSEKAWRAAYDQANEINCQDLREALTGVIFQMGVSWYKKFPSAWGYMKAHVWQAACTELTLDGKGKYPSLWLEQSPIRVCDFQIALLQQMQKD